MLKSLSAVFLVLSFVLFCSIPQIHCADDFWITSNQEYTLTQNDNRSFSISGGVVLDGNGFSCNVVYVHGSNVIIKNLVLNNEGKTWGIKINRGVTNCTIANNTIIGARHGINLNAKKCTIANNTILDCDLGIASFSNEVKDNIIINNTLHDCKEAIHLNGNFSRIIGNKITNSANYGIIAYGASQMTITNNIISNCDDVAILLDTNLIYSQIKNNQIFNCYNGIRIKGQNNSITENQIKSINQDGIEVFNDNNQILNNEISEFGANSINLQPELKNIINDDTNQESNLFIKFIIALGIGTIILFAYYLYIRFKN